MKLNSLLYGNRCVAYTKLDNYEKAIEDCNMSIQLNDKYIKGYLRRADLKQKIKEYDQAIGDYNKAKQLDSSLNISQ